MPQTAARLAALRAELADRKLDGFFVPLTDEHQSEYIAPYAQRLTWLTNFSGSAGNAVVLSEKAGIFVDGRYTLQVKDQVDGACFERHHMEETPLIDWTVDNIAQGARLGYDPALHTIGWVKKLTDALATKGAALVALDTNPIDAAWTDQPPMPDAPAAPHDTRYAGRSAANKRGLIAATLAKKGCKATVLTMLDSIAWAFNIRGKDVEHTPVVMAYAILRDDETATLFLDDNKCPDAVRKHLGQAVGIQPREAFFGALDGLSGQRVLVDPATASAAVFNRLQDAGATIVEGDDPCALPKAVKTQAETDGARAAHVRDGAAVAEFLHFLSVEAPKGTLDELTAVERLWQFRQKREMIQDTSFDTISGAGPNGAVIHYRVTPETNRPIKPGELYLVDSGGQYLDGTTDITRTIAVGNVGEEEKERFTRVLKGHIAVATARFPKGTTGSQIDMLARAPLWEVGLDYDHGTGHGVGAYLGVHEGPQRIAKSPSTVALQPGMICSNEPGYYKNGAYGIRIENLVIVRDDVANDDERAMLGFETITLAPIDRNLIKADLLAPAERDWLNAYHARVRETISPLVPDDVRAWLETATEAV